MRGRIDAGEKQWDNAFIFKVVCTLATSGFLQGYDTMSAALISLVLADKDTYHGPYIGFFISLGAGGAAVGALFSGPIADKYGRKRIIMLSNVLYLMGGLCMTIKLKPLELDSNIMQAFLLTGRYLTGVSIGVTSMNVPLYISEICPLELRGRVIAIYTCMIVTGQLVCNMLAMLLLLDVNWRYLVLFSMIFVVFQFVAMFSMPESPRWLAMNGRQEEADKVIKRVYKSAFYEIYTTSLRKEI